MSKNVYVIVNKLHRPYFSFMKFETYLMTMAFINKINIISVLNTFVLDQFRTDEDTRYFSNIYMQLHCLPPTYASRSGI
jgi:hypothetical protein